VIVVLLSRQHALLAVTPAVRGAPPVLILSLQLLPPQSSAMVHSLTEGRQRASYGASWAQGGRLYHWCRLTCVFHAWPHCGP
jgi:hypothetical protein